MKTSYRTCVLQSFKDAIFYRATCSCQSEKCPITLELEIDRTFGDITLKMWKKLACCTWWGTDGWFIEKWKRILWATRLLLTGYIEVEQAFIFDSEEHIDGFIQALTEGKERLKEGMKDAT